MRPHDDFWRAWRAACIADARLRRAMRHIQAAHDVELVRKYRVKYPRRRGLALWTIKERDPDLARAVHDRWKGRAARVVEWHRSERASADAALDDLASGAAIVTTRRQRPYRWIYAGSYRSQGLGADHYLKNAVQAEVDDLEHHGVEHEVDWDAAAGPDIKVRLDAPSVEALRRRPAIPLDERVRLCWKRGVNPRVYMPFLPYDYEERVGLDYFGGRTT